MSTNWLQDICNEHVNALTPYESARRLFSASEGVQRVWLNANEAPESDTYEINSSLLNRYPDCQPDSVLTSYAEYTNTFFSEDASTPLSKSNLICTRGADEGIELMIRAFCQPNNDSILICPPTYGMYRISADTFAVNTIEVPLIKKNEQFSLNVPAITEKITKQTTKQAAEQIKVIFLCSPNNPTGSLIAAKDIEDVLIAADKRCLVVVDEAYIEFSAQTSQQSLLNKYDNLVILRTLSKAHALAGIRCGFVLCSLAVKTILLKVIAPYPVPAPVASIAEQALSPENRPTLSNRIDTLNTEIKQISESLQKLEGVSLVGQQCGNFVLFRHARNGALMQYLVENNMLIRDQSKQVMLENCLRITVGTPAQNAQLLTLIEDFFKTEQSQKETHS